MSTEDLAAYGLAAAGITAVVVQILNDMWVSSSPLSSFQRAALLRSVNYLLNFGLIVLAVSTRGAFNGGNLFLYITVAFGQSVGSHTGWALLSKGTSGGGPSHSTQAPPSPVAVPRTPESLTDFPVIPRNYGEPPIPLPPSGLR